MTLYNREPEVDPPTSSAASDTEPGAGHGRQGDPGCAEAKSWPEFRPETPSPGTSAAYPARQQALKLLDDLCQDSLDVELAHVDALDRDGVLHQYDVSSKFKWLRDLIEANIRGAHRGRDRPLAEGRELSAATTEVEMNDPLHDALVAIFGAIAEREEKSIEEVVAEFVEGYERG